MASPLCVPITIEAEWRSKTVTTDPPRYTPHLEWAVGFTLTAAEPLRAAVFIEDAEKVAWGLVADDASTSLPVEVKFSRTTGRTPTTFKCASSGNAVV